MASALIRLIMLLTLATLVAACSDGSPSAQPWASSDSLPHPPQYIEVRFPEGTTPHTIATPNDTVPVNPEQPFYYINLWVEPNPNLITTEEDGFAWVPDGQPFTALFHFENSTTHPRTLTLLCLVNFTQIPCRSEADVLTSIVPSGNVIQEQVEVAGLPPGEHRLTVVALDYLPLTPYITDSPERIGDLVVRSGNFMWSHSVVLYVASYVPPAPTLTPVASGPDNPQSQGNLYFFTTTTDVTTTLDDYTHPNMLPNSNFHGAPLQVRPGELVQLNLVSGSSDQAVTYVAADQFNIPMDGDGVTFVLTAFLDTQQIPLTTSSAAGPLFGRVPRGNEVIVPLAFTAPETPGFYALSVLFQESPFFPRGKLVPQADGGVVIEYIGQITQLGISNRVIVEVIP